MIVALYKRGMTISELSSEYGIAKSTISDWVKELIEIKVSADEFLNLKDIVALKKEITGIKEENEILKNLCHISNKS